MKSENNIKVPSELTVEDFFLESQSPFKENSLNAWKRNIFSFGLKIRAHLTGVVPFGAGVACYGIKFESLFVNS